MPYLEHIQRLIEELGPATEGIEVVIQNGDAAWALAFDEDTAIALELDEQTGKILLSIELTRPDPTRRLAVYDTLLQYNSLGRDTGGVTMAVAGPDGEVVQMVALDASELTLDVLQTVLANFVEKARIWRGYIASGEDAPVGPEPLALGIRV